MHLDAAGDITDKAGDAEAHIAGVAHHGQNNCGSADNQTGDNHQQMRFGFLHFGIASHFS